MPAGGTMAAWAAHAGVEEQRPHGGDWLRAIVFGLDDGLVTTIVRIMAASEGASP